MRPLEGLLVVAMEQAVAAPFCTLRLAQAGARVIKVERAEGDLARRYDAVAGGDSSYFAWLNQGKQSIALNVKDPGDATLLRAMLARADVFVQNFAPGALARAGFDDASLSAMNGRLIRCNISGYGEAPGVAGRRGYDMLIQAESGLMAASGVPGAPGRIGVSVCDISCGATAYAAILEAIIARSASGTGRQLSVSLFDVAAEWMSVPYAHAAFGAGPPAPAGLKHPSIAPYGGFNTADNKTIILAVQNEREWQRLADALNAPALGDARFGSNIERVKHRDALDHALAECFRALTLVEARALLDAAKIANGALNTAADLAAHPAFRGAPIESSTGAVMTFPAPPVVGEGGPLHEGPVRVPALDAHGAAIRKEFAP